MAFLAPWNFETWDLSWATARTWTSISIAIWDKYLVHVSWPCAMQACFTFGLVTRSSYYSHRPSMTRDPVEPLRLLVRLPFRPKQEFHQIIGVTCGCWCVQNTNFDITQRIAQYRWECQRRKLRRSNYSSGFVRESCVTFLRWLTWLRPTFHVSDHILLGGGWDCFSFCIHLISPWMPSKCGAISFSLVWCYHLVPVGNIWFRCWSLLLVSATQLPVIWRPYSDDPLFLWCGVSVGQNPQRSLFQDLTPSVPPHICKYVLSAM